MSSRVASVPIRRELTPGLLAEPPDAETLDAADVDGFDGNRAFMDLRGMEWTDLSETLEIERALLARLEAAADLDEEEEAVVEELFAEYGVEALWSLDPGVASATIALSTLGATPVASCNGGVLGGHHKEAYPLVAFYLPADLANEVQALAEAAGTGLLVDSRGLAQIYGQSYRELVRFAELALAQKTAASRGEDAGAPHT